ncbi:MAG: pyridoxal-phosphate dependent enzyme [Sedimenticola thiotaurini]|uniref:Pyridoxal-phosphate dependent enzyme n=1 Tax=Sedimenticola thiotaurini TaxID=1543721 RepID=A0A558D478_9GAMM|nr:MAG: pyridoxal-phosphate dependent enzyme [Sedimenticola thiotaurini]
MSFIKLLQQLTASHLDQDLNWQSRCHPLKGYLPQNASAPIYIKREDELNANVVGTKHRKYLSLLPVLQHSGIRHVILIGSAHSNNVLGLSQMLSSRGYAITALVKEPGNRALTGNHLLLNMLLSPDQIRYISHQQWPDVEQIAHETTQALNQHSVKATVIPEGGYSEAVLPGILTVATDLQRNSDQLGIDFDTIWTDSGTGVSAIGLLLGMRLLGITRPTVHITQIAGTPDEFQQRYCQFEQWLEKLIATPLPAQRPEVRFIRPATATSYGSINKTILKESWSIARETGLLMDPVYSVKHLYTVKQEMNLNPPTGPQLVFYNGGTLGMSGFQSQLASQEPIV